MYDDFIATVKALIDEVGGDATFRSREPGVYDPATGQVTVSERVFSVRGALMELTLQSNGLAFRTGTEIMAGDKQFYMEPPETGVSVKPNDQITMGGVTYTVFSVKAVDPSGAAPILYDLYVRR